MWLLLSTLALAPTPVEIPAGTYTQGAKIQPDAPPRQVSLGAFRIDATEVSIADFEAWVAAGAYGNEAPWSPTGWAWVQNNPEGLGVAARAAGRTPDHPVVGVSWFEAEAYCHASGGRLPTEAEWERAACGGKAQDYPWGVEEKAAVWYDGGKFGHLSRVKTSPVSLVPDDQLSPEGLAHMAGNVWEWTADWYGPWEEGAVSDPIGPESGTWRVLRGGSYMNLPSYCRCQRREPRRPEQASFTAGFRCAY